ncbi:hypothetical protein EI42_02750 [Thermosporothrix hazakensis]|jgi:hypothetical protein|uniref:Uncharacterized protein n=2 Tax=Thermosporothrix TaxID=768650 RepID=A0A326U8D8_THEHA|nr:hypothetical protein [Thermosporothrix hazakensis]PZW29455.1 hypothetical protein EI42_02750 [Thermosporothrix hazakensis]BBH85741.1 hypothetical protein KTC_04920 [Thermosporothrix sp. COM3]GCE45830.1 hypothetical protein KTH_06990 [Thermosporothrix hazakensis]
MRQVQQQSEQPEQRQTKGFDAFQVWYAYRHINYAVLYFFFLTLLLTMINNTILSYFVFFAWLLLLFLIPLGIVIYLHIRSFQVQKRIDFLRSSAPHTQRILEPQPLPDAHVLHPPLIVRMRFHWFAWLSGLLVWLGLVFIPLITQFGPTIAGFFLNLPLGLGLLVLLLALYVLDPFRGPLLYPSFTITESGITAHYLWHRAVTIRWDEVRYFALTGYKTNAATETYELSDGTHTIRWRNPFSHNLSFYKPTMSREEYERFFRDLPAFIRAKTGRPLLDLRFQKFFLW